MKKTEAADATSQAPEWTHPEPGTLQTATVNYGDRVKHFRCTDAYLNEGKVRLVSGDRLVTTIDPETTEITYE